MATFTDMRDIVRDPVGRWTVPGIVTYSVAQDANVIPDEDADGFGAYVDVTIDAGPVRRSLLEWAEANDEVADD